MKAAERRKAFRTLALASGRNGCRCTKPDENMQTQFASLWPVNIQMKTFTLPNPRQAHWPCCPAATAPEKQKK